jgi:signal transduction histidine kinase
MAHEINNPLAGMMQNAQVIQNRLTLDMPKNIEVAQKVGISFEGLKQYIEERGLLKQFDSVNEAGIRAAGIVQNMLSFARKAEGVRGKNDLPELMRKTIELSKNDYDLKKKFDFNRIDIKIAVEKGFPRVVCEPGKIQQVFLNIIKNGAEAFWDATGSASAIATV